jgi:hypothetical protein
LLLLPRTLYLLQAVDDAFVSSAAVVTGGLPSPPLRGDVGLGGAGKGVVGLDVGTRFFLAGRSVAPDAASTDVDSTGAVDAIVVFVIVGTSIDATGDTLVGGNGTRRNGTPSVVVVAVWSEPAVEGETVVEVRWREAPEDESDEDEPSRESGRATGEEGAGMASEGSDVEVVSAGFEGEAPPTLIVRWSLPFFTVCRVASCHVSCVHFVSCGVRWSALRVATRDGRRGGERAYAVDLLRSAGRPVRRWPRSRPSVLRQRAAPAAGGSQSLSPDMATPRSIGPSPHSRTHAE